MMFLYLLPIIRQKQRTRQSFMQMENPIMRMPLQTVRHSDGILRLEKDQRTLI